MKYFIVRFYKEVPQIIGMTSIGWLDSYGIFSATTEAEAELLALNLSMEEITEDEVLIGAKFYSISREFRKAYSNVEGLEPDEEVFIPVLGKIAAGVPIEALENQNLVIMFQFL